MKRIIFMFAVFMVWGFPLVGHAEFYKYKNQYGETLFTDDLSRVPEDQRPKAVQYQDSLSTEPQKPVESPKADADTDIEAGQRSMADDAQTGDESASDETKATDPIETMNARRRELEAEYNALMKEKEELESTKAEFASQVELNVYHERIVHLNERISDYEQRRQAFSQEVDGFNAKQDAE